MTAILKKLTLLLIVMPSSLLMSLLASSMIQIIQEYPQYSESTVTMIMTIPNLTMMIGLFLAPLLLKRFSIKKLVLAGLILFTVCNVAGVWCSNFYLLLFLRALTGIGCGLIMPLQATLLAVYPEKERASLMGLGATVGCLTAAVLAAVSGIIAAINWRYVFLLYLINVIAIVMAVLFLPEQLEKPTQTKNDSSQDKQSTAPTVSLADYKKEVGFYYLLLTGGYLFVSILGSQIAPYLEYTHMGGTAESGLITSISLVGSTISGLLMGLYTRKLKQYSVAGLFFFAAAAFGILWLAPALWAVALAAFLLGFASALFSCTITFEMSRILPLELFTTVSAGISFFVFVLQFVAPMLCLAILDMVPGSSFRIVFMLYMAIQVFFLALAVFLPKVLFQNK